MNKIKFLIKKYNSILSSIIYQLSSRLNSRTIFLVDALGATLSTLLLGIIRPMNQKYIGLPYSALYLLAGIAVLFSFYSWGCYFLTKGTNVIWLKLISGANLSYCLLSAGVVVLCWRQVTALGILYFVLEIVVVVGLVSVEHRISKSMERINEK